MEQVRVVENFITQEESDFFINLTNFFETNNRDMFNLWQDGKRIALCFGNVENDIKNEIVAFPTLDIFGQEEPVIRQLFNKIRKTIKDNLELSEDLYVCSFWLAKQYPDAIVPVHSDTDNGVNNHFDYSVVLYLSSVVSGGKISFVDLNFSHFPKMGDFLYFNTRNTGDHLVSKIEENRYSLVLWLTKDESAKI